MKYLILLLLLTSCNIYGEDFNRPPKSQPEGETVYRKQDIVSIENECLLKILTKYNSQSVKERILEVFGESYKKYTRSDAEMNIIMRYFDSLEFACVHNKIQSTK